MELLTWLAAQNFTPYGIGTGVVSVASAVVYLAWRLLRANDQQVDRQLTPAWNEITALRKRIRRLERDRNTLLGVLDRNRLDVPEEVLRDDT